MDSEVWKAIPGFVGAYEVSSTGRVRSLDRTITWVNGVEQFRKGKELSLHLNSFGYHSVRLGRGRNYSVHRLVASAFIGEIPEGMVVRHLNDVPTDNRVENLAIGTQAENMQDMERNGNNHFSNKTHCSRGHEFVEANLAPWALRKGSRLCLACARARAYCRKNGIMEHWDSVSDRYYYSIISELNLAA